jgi:hypothetical protein
MFRFTHLEERPVRNRILYSVFIIVVVALAAAPAVFGQQDERAAQVLAMSRKAIGDKKLESLKTLSLDAVLLRNINAMQLSSDVELLFELPDKYVRTDQPNSPGMVVSGMSTGFNGDRAIQPVTGMPGGGGAFVIRMGPGGAAAPPAEKLSPEEQEKVERSMVNNAKQDLSRLMLGWFASTHPSVSAQYTFAGEAESPDGRAFVIDVKTTDGFAARLFIDQQTNLPLMVTYQGPQRQMMTAGGPGRMAAGGALSHGGTVVQQPAQSPQGRPLTPLTDEERKNAQDAALKQIEEMRKQPPVMVDYTLYFEDWQPIDGVQFPRKIRRAAAGATTEEWTVNKVKINPKIDPKKFAVQRS